MSITFKSFAQCVGYVCNIGKPVLLRSRHGVGKSSVVYAYAEYIGKPVVERRASQMTEGDLLGLPKLDNDKTEWCPPSWLKTACDEPVVLFIDEIDRATQEVRQGFFELTDSRKIAGWTLHPETLIFAAVNGGDHGEQYQVGEMDPAELDRWTVFDIEPSIEDWLDWAKRDNNIDKVIWDFINQNPQHLEHNEDFEPNKVYPSRRSWHRFSECISADKLINPGETSPIVFNLANAFVGMEAAFAFQDFVKSYQRQIKPEDILDNGDIEATREYDINEHSALVEKFSAQNVWETVLTEKQIDNLAKWWITLPSEVAMKLWQDIGDGKIENVLSLHSHKKVTKHIVTLLKGDEDNKQTESNK